MTYIPPLNGGRINASLGGNSTSAGAGYALVSSGTMFLAGGNNVTLSQNGASITISGGNAGNAHNVTLGGNSTSAGAGYVQISTGTMTIAGGNNVTLSQNGNAFTISAFSQSVQTQNLHNLTLAGNSTSAGAGYAQVSSGTLTLAGGNNVTLSQNGNAVTISALNQTAQTQSNIQAFYDGAVSISTGTVSLADGNGVSFGINGQTITASHNGITSQSVQTQSNVQAFYDGAASISTGTVSFADSNGVSFGINGQTLTGSVTGMPTLSRWEYPENIFTSIGIPVNGSLSLQHEYIPFKVTASAAKIAGSLTVASFNVAATASANYSLTMGLYTLNGSTLSLASSGSANNAVTWLRSGSSSQYTNDVIGLRQMTVPMNMNVTPGEYWMAALLSSATTQTGTSNMFTLYGNNQINATGVVGIIGSSTSAGRDVILGQGIYSAATGALPASIALSDINNTAVSNAQRAAYYHALYNATY
jgi:hypothetical protein